MLPYILRRMAAAVPVVWGVSTFVFLMIHLVPGDPVQLMYGNLPMSQADLDRIRTQLGLDQPLLVQYGQFFVKLLQGDLWPLDPLPATGRQRDPAAAPVQRAPGNTEHGGGARTGSPGRRALGHAPRPLAGHAHHRDLRAGRVGAELLARIDADLPVRGAVGVAARIRIGTPQHLVLPVLSLALLSSSIIARLTRSGMLDVLNMEYVTTARAKGLAERAILYRHALKNALIPVITIVGLQFGALLGGAFVVETVFAWPGVGRLAVQALSNRDYPIIQGVVLFVSLIVVLVNLATDVLYVAIDPRVRA